MNRILHPLITETIERYHFQRYLEIGLADARHFKGIRAPYKIGVDPVKPKIIDSITNDKVRYFQMDSLEFLSQYVDLLYDIDVAFIDGLHEYHQVFQESTLLMKHIKRGGVIFIHDCNPQSARASRPFGAMKPGEYRKHKGCWNGDVWKAILQLRLLYPEWGVKVLNTDQGLGVIRKNGEAALRDMPADLLNEVKNLSYKDLEKNRKTYLGLQDLTDTASIFG
jgi:hypothetical protein